MVFQIGSNLLDACVLSILRKEDAYGYKLTQELRSVMNVSESTLYPVLRRLVTKGFLETYDKEYMGRNRRYYHLTAQGIIEHEGNLKEWDMFSKKIDTLLKEGFQ